MRTIWIIAVLVGVLIGREKQTLRRLVRLHRCIITSLIATLDARKHRAELHSLRVRAYAARIAIEIGLVPGSLETLRLAALLHDVGKIGIRDHILLKHGPLDEREWPVMRQHPDIGYRILRSVPFLRQVAVVVRSHHEHYDGSVYPSWRKDLDVPVAARIFAVADAFDASTFNRPCWRPMTCEAARGPIENAKGCE